MSKAKIRKSAIVPPHPPSSTSPSLELLLILTSLTFQSLTSPNQDRILYAGILGILCFFIDRQRTERDGSYRSGSGHGTVVGLILIPWVMLSLASSLGDQDSSLYVSSLSRSCAIHAIFTGLFTLSRNPAIFILLPCLLIATSSPLLTLTYATICEGVRYAMRPLRKSFTWGEEMIVCQMVAVVGTDVMYKATHPVTSSPSTNLFLICELLVIGTLLVCCLFHHTYPSLQKRWSQVSANFKLALPWGLLGVYLLIYVIIVELTYRVNIIGTLFTFIFLQPAHTRPLLLFSLLLTAAIGAGIAFLLASHYPDLNSRRKYFHVLATTMFIPAVYVDPHLSALAFTVALCLFFLLELIRGYRLHPLGTPLHTAFGSFLDARDSGPVILAHIYLLGGCALPVFLACLSSNHSVSQYSGILLLGIGDTAASCIGQAYGSIYWPNRKTIEGTAAFVVGVFGGFMGVGFMSGGLSTSQVVVVFVSCLLSAILEAVTDQNDNLILPLFFWALLGGSN